MKTKQLLQLTWLSTLLILIAISQSFAQPPQIIDVVKGYEPIPLALVPFETSRGAEKYAEQLQEVLQFDLDFTNFFYLIPSKGQIDEVNRQDKVKKKVDYAAWREIGADAVVKGEINVTRSGQIEVEFQIYYAKGGTLVAKKKFRPFPAQRLRSMGHYISDQIVFHLTGNKGIAQTRIAFVYETLEAGKTIRELYLIDYDGNRDSLVRVTRDRDVVASPAWSPDGSKIAFTSYYQKNPDLNLIDLQTGDRKVISRYPGLNSSANWNPDGPGLVLVLTKDGNSELYTITPGVPQPRRLTYSKEIESSPCYSPDGKHIAYTSDRGKIVQVYTMDASGRNSKRVTPLNGWYDLPAWSPWGDTLAFVGSTDARRRFDIYTANSDGKNMRKLTGNSGSNESPCWSPDGRHIVFCSNRDGNWNLYTMDRFGQHVHRITYLPGNCYAPDWSPLKEED